MKKKIRIAFLLIVVLLISFKIYFWYSDQKLMKKTNAQLESLLEPYINNTVVVIDEDKYLLRINKVKLSDYVEPYKKRLSDSAYITFEIYKNKLSEENFIDTKLIEMEVWRDDITSDFYTNGKGDMVDISYKQQIFDVFKRMIFDNSYEDIRNSLSIEELENEYNSRRSHGNYNEDEIKFDNYGKITSPGEIKYESITYAKDLSMKFSTSFYIEDFKKYHEMYIDIEKAEGNYHVLWDMKTEDLENISFYFDGNYEENKTITNRSTIEKLVSTLKKMPFMRLEDQEIDYVPYVYIELDEYEHHITLSKDAVYTNSNHAVCQGKDFVNKILEILGAPIE